MPATERPSPSLFEDLRAGLILTGFLALTLPLMPVQAVLLRVAPGAARRLPCWYHRRVCRLIGVRITIDGPAGIEQPTLIIANHTSWLDIPVLSAVAPLTFVAKSEVARWPLVSRLARLQQTVFVERARRTTVAATAAEIGRRLASGGNVVLFAEGTSSDGNRVLPFTTSLLAAAKPTIEPEQVHGVASSAIVVRTLAIAYVRRHGLPLTRSERASIGWYGDMDLPGHVWRLLGAGPLDVEIRIGPAVPLAEVTDRKTLARYTEMEVRESLVRILRSRKSEPPSPIAVQQSNSRIRATATRPATNKKWK